MIFVIDRPVYFYLQIVFDDQPLDIAFAGEVGDLLGGVWIIGHVEEQCRKLWTSPRRVVEEVLAGQREDAVVGRYVFVGVIDQFLEVGKVCAADREPLELRQRGMLKIAVVGTYVVEPFI